jgi:alpha-glucosidase (family GH31 glycosyl hydrolase)
MIRHRPFGRGHPYLIEPDQRVPPHPLAGEPFELRATTSRHVGRVEVELESNGALRVCEASLMPGADSPGEATEGHLAAAARRQEQRGRVAWRAAVPRMPHGSRLRYRFIAHAGERTRRTRWFDVSSARWQTAGGELLLEGPEALAGRLVADSVGWLVADRGPIRARFALRLDPEERVVGFGERFNALDQRGRRLDSVVFEQYKRQGARTYLPMPFAIVAGGGWAFHVATSRRVWFDVGATEADRLWIEVDLEPAESASVVHLQLFAGSPTEVLGEFLERTGRPKLPPDWIFRPWMSANEWNTQERVLAEVVRSADERIPVGVVVIEAWSDESTFVAFRDAEYEPHPDGSPHGLADFRFPPNGAWPDPKGMVEELHGRGIKVLLWQIPLLKTRPVSTAQALHDRDVMLERGYAVKLADGRAYRNRGWWFPGALLPDLTNEEACDWWMVKRRYLVEELGVDGFKTDGGEHAWGHDLRYADGTTGGETNSRFPLLYARAYHQLLERAGRDGITFSRAGFTGSPAYPCHWAGDEDSTWEAFRSSILAGLTAGASGIFFWGWDLAGFSGEIPTAELYLRAAAMACFCPIMQYHSEFNRHRLPSGDRTPWNIAERTGDPRVIPIYRRFAELRERLVPYLSEQARRSLEQSKPLMRALFFDFPDDPWIWEFQLQYLLGDDLLVAPVTDPGAGRWTVYLPPGDWIDAWTDEPVAGPSIIERDVPLDVVPVYVRSRPDAGLDGLRRALRGKSKSMSEDEREDEAELEREREEDAEESEADP